MAESVFRALGSLTRLCLRILAENWATVLAQYIFSYLQYTYIFLQYTHIFQQYTYIFLQYTYIFLQYTYIFLQYIYIFLQYTYIFFQYTYLHVLWFYTPNNLLDFHVVVCKQGAPDMIYCISTLF